MEKIPSQINLYGFEEHIVSCSHTFIFMHMSEADVLSMKKYSYLQDNYSMVRPLCHIICMDITPLLSCITQSHSILMMSNTSKNAPKTITIPNTSTTYINYSMVVSTFYLHITYFPLGPYDLGSCASTRGKGGAV